jgi:DNA-binding transcriptional ArsR family regulator
MYVDDETLLNRVCEMSDSEMSPELLQRVAARFKALGEPARLRILQALRAGEKTVSDLMQDADLSQANTSRHLQVLHGLGFVELMR